MYNQRKAITPEAIPIFVSGISCSSTSVAMSLIVSGEHVVGEDAIVLVESGNTSLILPMGHEKFKPTSMRWSVRVLSSLSIGRKMKNKASRLDM